jgi:small subunit ribosomal protein S13
MARIAGVDLPNNKQLRIALTYIYGIGNPRALRILTKADLDPFRKLATLSEDEINQIRQVIEQEGGIEGDLRKEVSMNIKRLIDIQSYRGLRHRRNLPAVSVRTPTHAPARARARAQ